MGVWKRDDLEPEPESRDAQASSSPRGQTKRGPSVITTVGSSNAIDGTVTGDNDLLVRGRVTGKIILLENSVTIANSGRVQAEIRAKSISVLGEVVGDLIAGDEVVVHPSGSVQGNILAPRVRLESGCRFKGSIDMEKAPSASSAKQKLEPSVRRPQEIAEPVQRASAETVIGSGS